MARSLWFVVELELNLGLGPPDANDPPQYGSITSIRELWYFIWKEIQVERLVLNHATSRPRLRALRVLEGHRTRVVEGFHINYTDDFEVCEQVIFEARLSERDDLAKMGHADVKCLGLEALQNKYGHGPYEKNFQRELMQDMTDRAENGAEWTRSFHLGKQLDLLRPLRTPLLRLVDAN
ncbi:MAG: hypothetical protein Q9219_004856 [cf. Caloplaca sp. 3 TL-2023]